MTVNDFEERAPEHARVGAGIDDVVGVVHHWVVEDIEAGIAATQVIMNNTPVTRAIIKDSSGLLSSMSGTPHAIPTTTFPLAWPCSR